MKILLFLSSGLFLGWSLGANNMANVFGTAVGSRMVHFRLAAVLASIFVVLGATISGAGTANTLGALGAVDAIAGSFTVALAAALSMFWMTRIKLPVSTSQTIVGAIIGWNIYTHSITDSTALTKILLTWLICPLLAALVAIALYFLLRLVLRHTKIHLLRQDAYTRFGLLVVGAFGAYSLGANNISTVMGVFVPVSPFEDYDVFGLFTLTGVQQLFLLGGLAIAVGIFTYSEKVIRTVGGGLMKLSPMGALVIVLAQSIVLFLFASEGLEYFLASHGLPTIPLVPVSSSQAVIGAIIGVGIAKGGGRGIRYRVLGEISLGWLATPVIAGVIAFFALFFMNNVFRQEVNHPAVFRINETVLLKAETLGINTAKLEGFTDETFENSVILADLLKKELGFERLQVEKLIELSEVAKVEVTVDRLHRLDREWIGRQRYGVLQELIGYKPDYAWQLADSLAVLSPLWRLRPDEPVNKIWNAELKNRQGYTLRQLSIPEKNRRRKD